jgi:hypothetical protein
MPHTRHLKHRKKERGANMDVEHIKYQTCPYDNEEGILLVDPETESMPETDSDGDLQYYCLAGQHTFSLDEDD